MLGLCSINSLLGFELIYKTQNKILYQSMENSISYSAYQISENLEAVENLSSIILKDTQVQGCLAIANDRTSSYSEQSDAYRSLSYLVSEYYQNYEQYGISYINLYNASYTSYSDFSISLYLPDDIAQNLLEQAHLQSGYAVWNTDYCTDFGLFLVRDVRRADRLQLDTIGTILMNINLESVITDAATTLSASESPSYLLYDCNNTLLYTSFDEDSVTSVIRKLSHDYGVVKIDGQYYFYAKETIPNYEWEFICLTPYNSVIHVQHLYMFICVFMVIFIYLVALLISKKLFGTIAVHVENLLLKMKMFGENNTQLYNIDYDYSARHDELGELHTRFDQTANQVIDLIQKNYVMELLNKDAELKSLENQINPHFLYNTLESINWRAKSVGANEIAIMVESLGALLRSTLSRKNNTITTIKSELDIVQSYICIMQIRFEEILTYSVEIPEDLYDVPLPKLSLQPLVENAIDYGLEEAAEACHIAITVSMEGDDVLITITNNGSQFPENLLQKLSSEELTPHGFGIGLLNIQKRLQLQFGQDYGLTLKNDEMENLAIVEVRIPYSK